ncbi:MAG TPA: hypothetical protein VET48_09255, partial [Steroidobacteraceae bacterium]|nr:hypothetical protein [Steroidobacteraceae bacterium]
VAQPLQITGTNSDHSVGRLIVRRLGIVWTVAASNDLAAWPPAFDSEKFLIAAQRPNSYSSQTVHEADVEER